MKIFTKKEPIFKCSYEEVYGAMDGIATHFRNEKYKVNLSKITGSLHISKEDFWFEMTIAASKVTEDNIRVEITVTGINDYERNDIEEHLINLNVKYCNLYSDILLDALTNNIEGKSSFKNDLAGINFEEMMKAGSNAQKTYTWYILFWAVCIFFLIWAFSH